MYLYHNIETDTVLNNNEIYARETLIKQLKSRFSTYGYREISTSVFEKYNLYATMNGTVNHREMIKTIDNTGQVLVLRPDITIPLTKELANNSTILQEDLRYFYVLDVYRQITDTHEYRQHTQAGVEYFGNPSAEADAEIIALAAHILQDLKVGNFTIELGHAGFFKQIMENIELNDDDFRELKRIILGKNVPDMEGLLQRIDLSDDMQQIIRSLPLLYGKLPDVLAKTAKLPLTAALKEKLADIEGIYKVLEAYDVADHIVIDLSLINHMDYYSDIIFQGFIERIGKTVLMGGRYDTLSKHFKADFPAIGFAYDIDLLLAGSSLRETVSVPTVDFVIEYDKQLEKRAIQLAQSLRVNKLDVVTYASNTDGVNIPESSATIRLEADSIVYQEDEVTEKFASDEELLQAILQTREE